MMLFGLSQLGNRQWVSILPLADRTTWAFPIAFSNKCYSVAATITGDNQSSQNNIAIIATTTTSFTMLALGGERKGGFYVMAIGA